MGIVKQFRSYRACIWLTIKSVQHLFILAKQEIYNDYVFMLVKQDRRKAR